MVVLAVVVRTEVIPTMQRSNPSAPPIDPQRILREVAAVVGGMSTAVLVLRRVHGDYPLVFRACAEHDRLRAACKTSPTPEARDALSRLEHSHPWLAMRRRSR